MVRPLTGRTCTNTHTHKKTHTHGKCPSLVCAALDSVMKGKTAGQRTNQRNTPGISLVLMRGKLEIPLIRMCFLLIKPQHKHQNERDAFLVGDVYTYTLYSIYIRLLATDALNTNEICDQQKCSVSFLQQLLLRYYFP